MAIPKVFHRVWLGGPMPTEFAQYGDTWADHNPTWKMREWGEQDCYDILSVPSKKLWDEAPDTCKESRLVPRFRSNVARAEILYRYGGVYLDTDMEALRPMGDVLDGVECFAVLESPKHRGNLVANGVMGAERRHPWMKALRDGMTESVAARPGKPSWRTTGPEHATRTFAAVEGCELLPTPLFYPWHHTEYEQRHLFDTSNSIGVHHCGSTRKSVSVIIPWADDGSVERKESLEYVIGRLDSEHPDWQIVLGDGDAHNWCKGDAVGDVVADTFGDVVVVHDADVWCDGLEAAVETIRSKKNTTRWAIPHKHVRRLTKDASTASMASGEFGGDLDQNEYVGVEGGGIVVLERSLLEAVPIDRKFVGWGGEDVAWSIALKAVAGSPWRGDVPLWHLWHEPQKRISRSLGSRENKARLDAYKAAKANRKKMEALVAGKEKPAVVKPLGPLKPMNTYTDDNGETRTAPKGGSRDRSYSRMKRWKLVV